MSIVELFVLANVAVLGCFCAWADTERQMALALRCGVGLLYYGLWAVALLATFVRSVLLFAGIGWLGLIFISHPVGFLALVSFGVVVAGLSASNDDDKKTGREYCSSEEDVRRVQEECLQGLR